MKLWTESVWDWLAVAQTNRKSNNKNRTKMKKKKPRMKSNLTTKNAGAKNARSD